MVLRLANIIHTVRRRLPKSHSKMRQRYAGRLKFITTLFDFIALIGAIAFVTSVTVYLGFDHDNDDRTMIIRIIRSSQVIFMIDVIFNLIFNKGQTFRGARILSWTINVIVLITLVPWILRMTGLLYSLPGQTPHIIFVIVVAILTIYSAVKISYGIMSLLSRRTNPSLILSASFLIFILIGTVLLMLPRCSYYPISLSDAVFLSTSAVCITGLTPVDVATVLTPLGQLVLALLVQTGALGVMTFTSFFALFFTGSSSIYSQMLLSDIIYSRSMSSLIPMLLYVLGITLFIEACGALMIYLTVHGTLCMSFSQEIAFSCFHAVSAFCNAGFSTLPDGMSNPTLLYGNQIIYWVLSLLIVAGAIGFPILANFKDAIFIYLRRRADRLLRRKHTGHMLRHIYSMNTKIVLVWFSALLIFGAVCFWLLERDNTLEGMTPWQQVTQSVFNSVTPRSAGFSSVNPAAFLAPTVMIVLFLMWIGGGSQSTAGGIKVNTFATVLLFLKSVILGRRDISVFHRSIAIGSIRRASAVVTLSILSYAFFSIVLVIVERDLPARSLLFEAMSALFTVGSSMGITGDLSSPSKILLCFAMFIGRVGLLSLLMGFARRYHDRNINLPEDTIIIS